MLRQHKQLTKDITLIFGYDHALGSFIQITDARYASTPEDKQGEGYVFEWDERFGVSTDLIDLQPPFNELELFFVLLTVGCSLDATVISKCNQFIKTLKETQNTG